MRNPFLGTLLFVWMVRNWRVIYTVFNFDEDCTLSDKLMAISLYFKDYGFWEILITTMLAVITLIGTYLLINMSRLIINASELIIAPWINSRFDKTKVVPREKFDLLRDENTKLEDKYIDEQTRRHRADTEAQQKILEHNQKSDRRVEDFQVRNKDLERQVDEYFEEKKELQNRIDTKSTQISALSAEARKKDKEHLTRLENYHKVDNVLYSVLKSGKESVFLTALSRFTRNISVTVHSDLNQFVELGLLKLHQNSDNELEVTQLGMNLYLRLVDSIQEE